MPTDTSLKQSKRRPEKHFTQEELKVIEQKRLRGELSCAECRRLKLRCDKKVPCSSCVRRGCGSICPQGVLEAGVGSRFVLASTNQLHNKMSIMSARIRALEDALAILQSTVSSEKHPMLDEQFLNIKFTSDIPLAGGEDHAVGNTAMQEGASGSAANASSADMSELDALGTLTIGENRAVTYFGRSAGNEALLAAQEELLDLDSEAESDYNDKQDDDLMSMMTANHRDSIGQSSDFNGRGSWSTEQHGSPAIGISPSVSTSATSPESNQSPHSASEDPASLPPELYNLPLGEAWSLYDGQHATELTVPSLLKHLPSYERAKALVQTYFDYGSMFFRPITKAEVMEIVLPQVYFLSEPPDANLPVESTPTVCSLEAPTSSGPSPHLLAGLFFVFALGAYFDLSLHAPSYETEAELWFQLGRKALVSRRGVIAVKTSRPKTDLEDHSNAIGAFPSSSTGSSSESVCAISTPLSGVDETIGALGLMANYLSMASKKYSRDSSWCTLSVAAKLAQSAGLHRDPTRWELEPKLIQRRRRLFWELFQADMANSLALGRPPCTPLSFVDCEFPTDEEATLDDKGKVMTGLWQLKYHFSRDGYMPIANTTLTVKLPSYARVMEIDKQIRQVPIPPTFRPVVTIEDEGEEAFHDGVSSLRDFYGSQYRNAALVYLHRSFFAHAMLTHPSNPLSSPFASSFLTAYRASSEMIKAALNLFDRNPELFGRMWFITYHVFSAALVVGSVVRRCPSSTVAPSALMDLSMAVDLYEKHAYISRRHRVACFVLKKLKTRATRLYAEWLATKGTGPPGNSPFGHPESQTLDPDLFSAQKTTEFEENIGLFGGKTKVLTKKKRTKDTGEKQHRDGSSRGQSDSNSPQSSVTDSPSPRSDSGIGGYPSSHTSPPMPTDGLAAASASDYGLRNVDMPMDFDLGTDFNFDADLGFGMDSGGGMVMNMALEDINMGNDTGTQRMQSATSSSGSGFNSSISNSGSGAASSLMGYMGGTDVKVAPAARLGHVDPYSSLYPQTATAQAAMMFGMGPSAAQMPPSTQSQLPNVGANTGVGTGTTEAANPQIDAAELYTLFTEYLARRQSPTIPSTVPIFGDTSSMSFGQGVDMMPSMGMGNPNFTTSTSQTHSPTAQLGQAHFVPQQQQQGEFSWQPQGPPVNIQDFTASEMGAGTSLGDSENSARDYDMFFRLLGLDRTQM